MKKVILLAIVGVFLVAAGTATLLWTQFLNGSASASEQEIIYEVLPGKSFSTVAKELETKGAISNAALFSLFARLRGDASKMKVGEYMLRPSMHPHEVLEVIISGKSIGRNFTIAEGLNMFEIAAIVAQTGIATRDEFIRAVEDPALVKSLLGEPQTSLEGYLFPETYQVTKFTDLKTLLRAMVGKFMAVYATVADRAKEIGLTRHQVATLASIVEKETGAPDERPLISSIFHNRMQKGMMLQTDPTVLYAKMRKTRNYEISITRLDLLMDDDYNTYRRKGLPPGPIANAGADAIRAAVNPAKSEYLFFVSQNNGRHIFSKSYADHQKAVVKFQIDPHAREGKSWRDLNKTPPKPAAPSLRK